MDVLIFSTRTIGSASPCQGSQFTSEEFTRQLLARDIRISMDSRGWALDNIFVERLWRSVKYEDVYLKGYETMVRHRKVFRGILRFITRNAIISLLDTKHQKWFILGGALNELIILYLQRARKTKRRTEISKKTMLLFYTLIS